MDTCFEPVVTVNDGILGRALANIWDVENLYALTWIFDSSNQGRDHLGKCYKTQAQSAVASRWDSFQQPVHR